MRCGERSARTSSEATAPRAFVHVQNMNYARELFSRTLFVFVNCAKLTRSPLFTYGTSISVMRHVLRSNTRPCLRARHL